jgi:hypothetical protein
MNMMKCPCLSDGQTQAPETFPGKAEIHRHLMNSPRLWVGKERVSRKSSTQGALAFLAGDGHGVTSWDLAHSPSYGHTAARGPHAQRQLSALSLNGTGVAVPEVGGWRMFKFLLAV